jgi:hypothetical protein
MSGGGSTPDPYYQKDPPKTYRDAVKPIRIEIDQNGKRWFFYECEHCGKEFKDDKRKKHKRAFCDKKCQFEWQKYGKPKPEFSPEARKKISDASKKSWKDNYESRLAKQQEATQSPEARKKRAKSMEKVRSDPAWSKKISETMKKVANDPEWKENQSEKHKGRKRPPEVSRKISQAKMGHEVSEETRKKLADAARGENSYFWKGGISGERERFYSSWEWKTQRERILQRDNHTCLGCGWNADEVQKMCVHHIDPLETTEQDPYDYPDELLATLCDICHGATEYQDGSQGDLLWPVNGRGEEAKLHRVEDLKSKQTKMDDF